MKKLRIGVIYGGRSSEHEVSLASAASVIANLDRSRYDPVPIRIDRDGRWTIADRPPTTIAASAVIAKARQEPPRSTRTGREAYLVPHPGEETVLTIERNAGEATNGRENAYVAGLGLDVVFPVLHGPYGEDGTVQGLLELANVPYVGSGVLASAVGMDKAMMKVCFAARGLPIVKHLVAWRDEWAREPDAIASRVGAELRPPVFVKPANLGSSVGISKAGDRAALGRAIELAAQYDRKIVIEEAVPAAREIECSVVGNARPEASVPGEILPSREFYDYEAKYLEDSPTLVPAPLDEAETARVRQLAVEAFLAVEASGYARVDLLASRETGDIFVNEINTIPGFTTISMFPKLWEATGLPYPALLDRLVELAFERHAAKQALRTGRP
ncbi:MAG TPA: D-alanine--D-alanine ligase family protein [Vicinamibacterales bacterium]|nr:D-alanine--D-alanine ligase [Acidobacteriota bacterium]HOC16620.1 D-alanine--D-alanine ligase family protein [Vicinamibacterales bacterium]